MVRLLLLVLAAVGIADPSLAARPQTPPQVAEALLRSGLVVLQETPPFPQAGAEEAALVLLQPRLTARRASAPWSGRSKCSTERLPPTRTGSSI